MHKYELMYIVRPDMDEEAVKATREKVAGVITNNGGEVVKTDDMGKRRLAYLINKYREGVYTVVNFNGEATMVSELERVINIDENIIRHMVVNMDEK
ncbi:MULTISPECIES: 30S ribosomal protein S6 [Thermoactinomycetaceae]|uniref:Small ribosomal subunit protein bS6 n=2 Tax=Thermoactinomycetaceae TaxID=186824 RepID=A0A4R2RZB4_9BACL|nr:MULTISPECIES: 30S ribosomal protein S6 [Thermoactinomycetaceae]MDQ0417855.1 small subunit ribosomal protein S6 [Croceifilum oryzae]TCP70259.1 SSU ribosomal protein S6P [Baia soyae]